ncbi:MAG: sugar transferase, partial [Coprobacillus cateniformis]
YYTDEERHRHDVRPGLTGLAQISGRNYLSWKERFKLDCQYVNRISFILDLSIILKTIIKVFQKDDIMESTKQLNFKDLDKERMKNGN